MQLKIGELVLRANAAAATCGFHVELIGIDSPSCGPTAAVGPVRQILAIEEHDRVRGSRRSLAECRSRLDHARLRPIAVMNAPSCARNLRCALVAQPLLCCRAYDGGAGQHAPDYKTM